jgi:uracil-DNA glycosylase
LHSIPSHCPAGGGGLCGQPDRCRTAAEYPALPRQSGNLSHWAEQGVFLLNAILTVEDSKPAAHQNIGWEQFTDAVIRALSTRKNLVYMLWGSYAQKKAEFVKLDENLILKSVHPSPLSAHRGFFGNHHFSRANEYLAAHGNSPINW